MGSENGRRLLAIRARIQTVSVLDKIFPVDDFLESVVDPQTFLPLRFTRRLSEGPLPLHEVTTFDHAALQAHWKHLLRKGFEQDFAIEADTRDADQFHVLHAPPCLATGQQIFRKGDGE